MLKSIIEMLCMLGSNSVSMNVYVRICHTHIHVFRRMPACCDVSVYVRSSVQAYIQYVCLYT